MPKYQYTAKDVAGKKKKGQLMAADEAALYELLRGENLFLISCRLAQKEKKNTYRLTPRQLSEFCRQLGTLLGAGVPLVRALNLMQAEETIKPKQKAIYENMIRSVRRGNSFADTMKDQGDAFPELLINMFRAAQESGRMDQTALRMAEHYQKEYRLSAKIKSATLYPKILCGVIVVVVMILFCSFGAASCDSGTDGCIWFYAEKLAVGIVWHCCFICDCKSSVGASKDSFRGGSN